MNCPKCEKTTQHNHMRDCAHGIPETHMAESERIVCCECGYHMYGEEAAKQGIKFFFDDNRKYFAATGEVEPDA